MKGRSIKNRTLWIFGDSNAYGWDPRDPFGGPYEKTWPEILRDKGYFVSADALPGREIPREEGSLCYALHSMESAEPRLVILQLGTNDLLNRNAPDAESVCRRMSVLLEFLKNSGVCHPVFLLMAIPPLRVSAEAGKDGAEYNRCLSRLAEQSGCYFFQAPEEEDTAFDGVHLTEEAHARTAEKLADFLSDIYG